MSPLCLSVIRRASVATYDLQCILCGPRNKGTQRAATSKVQSVFITLEGWGVADVELCSDICNELQNCGDTWTPSPQSGVLWGMCGVPSLFYRMTERHLGELSMWAQGTDYAERGRLRWVQLYPGRSFVGSFEVYVIMFCLHLFFFPHTQALCVDL